MTSQPKAHQDRCSQNHGLLEACDDLLGEAVRPKVPSDEERARVWRVGAQADSHGLGLCIAEPAPDAERDAHPLTEEIATRLEALDQTPLAALTLAGAARLRADVRALLSQVRFALVPLVWRVRAETAEQRADALRAEVERLKEQNAYNLEAANQQNQRNQQRADEMREALEKALRAIGYVPHMAISDDASQFVGDTRREIEALLARSGAGK